MPPLTVDTTSSASRTRVRPIYAEIATDLSPSTCVCQGGLRKCGLGRFETLHSMQLFTNRRIFFRGGSILVNGSWRQLTAGSSKVPLNRAFHSEATTDIARVLQASGVRLQASRTRLRPSSLSSSLTPDFTYVIKLRLPLLYLPVKPPRQSRRRSCTSNFLLLSNVTLASRIQAIADPRLKFTGWPAWTWSSLTAFLF